MTYSRIVDEAGRFSAIMHIRMCICQPQRFLWAGPDAFACFSPSRR